MKICHCISSIDKNSGGTSTYLQKLTIELAKYYPIEIATLNSPNPLLLSENVDLFLNKKSFPQIFGYSKGFKKQLQNSNAKLFHGNGLWQLPVHMMCKIAQSKNIPYILSPHGMLEPWALNTHQWKKKLGLWFYQYNDLAKAACIHATAQMEADHIRKLGFKNPIAIIPNGIDLSEFMPSEKKQQQGKNTILFLSRIHPKKGIELLIKAWAQLDNTITENWKVEIAGNGEPDYIDTLQQLISKKELTDEIKIIGPQFGSDKLKTYQNADIFVLPTYSENFGIVIAEALACGVPVITTKGTPWEELNTRNAGWWIDIGVKPLVEALNQALQISESKRQLMGRNGRKLVEENYSIESVAKMMIELYKYILYQTVRPEFVYDIELKHLPISVTNSVDKSSDITINHVISSIDVSAGGPSSSVKLLNNELIKTNRLSNITTIHSANPIISSETKNSIYFIKNNILRNITFYFYLKKNILFKNSTILHGHGIWQLPVHMMAVFSRKNQIKYIMSPRGMLEPWALNTSKWKKKAALFLYQNCDLANASCIHATAAMEAENIRKLGFKNPIAVIPNGIDLSEFPLPQKKFQQTKRTVLFLSRINPKKGIEILIEAWALLELQVRKNWQLDIAGNGQPNYIAELKQQISDRGLESEIHIIGSKYGKDKLETYYQANIFVLPTYSENFGNVVAEALACGVPVITTNGTPWEELNTCNAGWWIDIGVDPLVNALKQAIQLSDTERQLMGQNGRKLVEENYSIESVAAKMIRLYDWILKDGVKPEFVYNE